MRKSPCTSARREAGSRPASSARKASSKVGCGSPRRSCSPRSSASGSSTAGSQATDRAACGEPRRAPRRRSRAAPRARVRRSRREDLLRIGGARDRLHHDPAATESRVLLAVGDHARHRHTRTIGSLQQRRLRGPIGDQRPVALDLGDEPPARGGGEGKGLSRGPAAQAPHLLLEGLSQQLGHPPRDRIDAFPCVAIGAAAHRSGTSLLALAGHAAHSASSAPEPLAGGELQGAALALEHPSSARTGAKGRKPVVSHPLSAAMGGYRCARGGSSFTPTGCRASLTRRFGCTIPPCALRRAHACNSSRVSAGGVFGARARRIPVFLAVHGPLRRP